MSTFWKRGNNDPPPQPTSHGGNLSVYGVDSPTAVIKATLRVDDGTSYVGDRDISLAPMGRFKFFINTPPTHLGWGATIRVESEGYNPIEIRTVISSGQFEFPAVTLTRAQTAPKIGGIVNLVGHSWQDDRGLFFPLGTSLFWVLGEWHRHGPDRVIKNLEYLASLGVDYVRILAQAGWTGEEIDPDWPGYEQMLGEFLDTAFSMGIRTQITAIGGGKDLNHMDIAAKIIRVVASRRHTVMMLEAVNENNAPDDIAVSIAKAFAPLGLPFGVGLGNRGIGIIKECGKRAGGTVDYYHTERTKGDNGARQVRQCWNFKDFSGAAVNNEPPGPASSVATYDDPFKIACMRMGSTICGSGAFCYHTGSGVFGKDYQHAQGFRHANLNAVPSFTDTVTMLKASVSRLPLGIENWTKFNSGKPVEVSAGTVNKVYGARAGNQFAEIIIGAETPITFKGGSDVSIQIANPATGELILDTHLNKGQTVQVPYLWSYLVTGTIG